MRRLAVLVLCALGVAGCGTTGRQPSQPAGAVRSGLAIQAVNGPPRPVAPARHPRRTPVPILMYHVLGVATPGTPYPGLWVTPHAFAAQMRALAAGGYRAVTLGAVLDAWDRGAALPRRPIVLSFDDGYLGDAKVAGPVLRAHRWPGVLNLALRNVRSGDITAAQVRRLAGHGWEIDSHTISHPDLTTLGPAALRHELVDSRALIHRRFHQAANAFCYPAGRFDPRVEAAVRAAGYRAATTELPGYARPGERYALHRIRVSAGESPGALLAELRAAARQRF